ncbi:DUF1482 domain-containing protein [Enterobacter cancerogenus]|uniref:DUF1482 family protein n=1 Tax=Enterobacter cancerogenus TaxID=69218 RepID=UPI000C9C72B1|nr:DUF1482 family protein [Enterobacter cancerogenus]PNF10512.1 DUF1482 domain-containing protein [Enterobacter cancerogenus]
MTTLYALVLTVFLNTGEAQEQVIDIYDSHSECVNAAKEQNIAGDCYPVEAIIPMNASEIPAGY